MFALFLVFYDNENIEFYLYSLNMVPHDERQGIKQVKHFWNRLCLYDNDNFVLKKQYCPVLYHCHLPQVLTQHLYNKTRSSYQVNVTLQLFIFSIANIDEIKTSLF